MNQYLHTAFGLLQAFLSAGEQVTAACRAYIIDHQYLLIFINSMESDIILTLRSESAWFAALQFGGFNMVLATFLAFAGSTLGMSLNYALGYYASRWRREFPVYSEAAYNRLSRYFGNYLYLIMAIPPILILEFLPGLSLFAVVCGMFRVPPRQAITVIAISRALYYIYHLLA